MKLSDTPFTEVKNYLHGSNASLIDEIEIQEACISAPSTIIHDSKIPQKNEISAPNFLKIWNSKYKILTAPAFLTSNLTPHTLNLSSIPD